MVLIGTGGGWGSNADYSGKTLTFRFDLESDMAVEYKKLIPMDSMIIEVGIFSINRGPSLYDSKYMGIKIKDSWKLVTGNSLLVTSFETNKTVSYKIPSNTRLLKDECVGMRIVRTEVSGGHGRVFAAICPSINGFTPTLGPKAGILSEILVQIGIGQWSVQIFKKDDIYANTSLANYNFQFLNGGKFQARNGSDIYIGSWKLTEIPNYYIATKNDILLEIILITNDPDLQILSNFWLLSEYNSKYFKVVDRLTAQEDSPLYKLTFNKL